MHVSYMYNDRAQVSKKLSMASDVIVSDKGPSRLMKGLFERPTCLGEQQSLAAVSQVWTGASNVSPEPGALLWSSSKPAERCYHPLHTAFVEGRRTCLTAATAAVIASSIE